MLARVLNFYSSFLLQPAHFLFLNFFLSLQDHKEIRQGGNQLGPSDFVLCGVYLEEGNDGPADVENARETLEGFFAEGVINDWVYEKNLHELSGELCIDASVAFLATELVYIKGQAVAAKQLQQRIARMHSRFLMSTNASTMST